MSSASREIESKALKLSPAERLYDAFIERIGILRANPPSVPWDGAFTFQTK